MLMALGQFVFSTDTLTFNEIDRSREYNYATNATALGRDTYQYTGVGADTVSIPYIIYEGDGFGKRQAVEDLAEMAEAGEGYVLVNGAGYVYGVYVIKRISDKRSVLLFDGVPLKVDGSLELTRVDDSRVRADRAPTSNTPSSNGAGNA